MLILGFVALFGVSGSGNPSDTGGFPTTTTTMTTRSVPTSTTIVTLKGLGPQGTNQRAVLVFVVVPNVVGMTLTQADPALSAVGLSSEVSTPATAPAGTSSTGTILAQAPVAGSQAQQGQVIQLSVSGY
ncbi:MAG: PASTA domain-containing protein [Acidimicrobiales bacterium]